MPILEFDQVTKYYGKNKGVDKLSLSVNKGDVFGFIGPNGAGKSTTIRLLMNFIFPNSGEITVFGEEVSKNATAIKSKIGYMPSEVYFYETMKVQDLINYSADLKGVKDRAYIKHLIDILDLDVQRRFGNLSYGNKKKVSIVQAFMHRPEILVLDEPTNGLDPLMQKTLLELIREENKNGTTVFFSSHSLSVVQKLCNNIGIIKEGEMIAMETFETLRKKQIKKVSFETMLPMTEDLLNLQSISDFKYEDQRGEFYFSGSYDELFEILSHKKIVDFNMTEPELEEIFMHFYSNGGGSYGN